MLRIISTGDLLNLNFLMIENNNSKQGYHNKTTIYKLDKNSV